MTKQDFINRVVEIGYKWAEYVNEGKSGVAFQKDNNKFFISKAGIETQDWDKIKQGIPNLTHMTRIVGYYSRVNNWNPSKLGELGDRHNGRYVINNG